MPILTHNAASGNPTSANNAHELSATRGAITPADLAAQHGFKKCAANGVIEYHGPNPTGAGAQKDGFILNSDGTAYDRSLGQTYTSEETAKAFGIEPEHYAPVAEYRSRNGHTKTPTITRTKTPPQTIAYDYRDENGELLYQVVRKQYADGTKDFLQRRPDTRGGWLYSLKAGDKIQLTTGKWVDAPKGIDGAPNVVRFPEITPVLYNLRDVLQAQNVFPCEGEKAADRLNAEFKKAGVYGENVATTSQGGAGKFKEHHAKQLAGKVVIVLPDNDEPGEAHAQQVCALSQKQADSVALVKLPNLPPKGDVCEYFAAGGTVPELLEMASNAPTWMPAPIAEKPKRFHLAPLSEIFTRTDPAFLVHRLLTIGGTSLLTAKHASFKSFIALDIALSVATGRLWHGFEVKRGAVVYIAAEGASGLKKRAAAWLAHHSEETPENFFVIDVPLQIADAGLRAAFIEEIAELNPALIVLDTLARCAVGMDENNAGDMGQFADALGELARASGAHVMTVHHNNKDGGYRGSSAVPAAVDTHLSMERNGDSVTLKTEKQKDAEELPPLCFESEVVTIPNSGGESHSLVFHRLSTNTSGQSMCDIEQRAFSALVESYGGEPVTAAQWKRAAMELKGLAESTFSKARRGLVQKRAVLIVSGVAGGKGKDAAVYQIAPDWLPGENDEPESDCSTERSTDSVEQKIEPEAPQKPENSPNEANNGCSTLYGCSTDSVEHDSTAYALRSTPLIGVESVERKECAQMDSEPEPIPEPPATPPATPDPSLKKRGRVVT